MKERRFKKVMLIKFKNIMLFHLPMYEIEKNTFNREKPFLLMTYEIGTYITVIGRDIIGGSKDFADAFQLGNEKMGGYPFLVEKLKVN